MSFKKKLNKSQKEKYLIGTYIVVFNILFAYLSKEFQDFSRKSVFNKINIKLKPDNFFRKDNEICDRFDPLALLVDRLIKKPQIICEDKESRHICYQNSKYNRYNRIFYYKYGVICKSENFILDPSKSNQTNYIYKGPIDKIHKGSPILSKGFFNMKCKRSKKLRYYNRIL